MGLDGSRSSVMSGRPMSSDFMHVLRRRKAVWGAGSFNVS